MEPRFFSSNTKNSYCHGATPARQSESAGKNGPIHRAIIEAHLDTAWLPSERLNEIYEANKNDGRDKTHGVGLEEVIDGGDDTQTDEEKQLNTIRYLN